MGQQQLLLLVLGIVIVGLAVVVGIQAFGENQKKANADALVNDGVRIASDAQAWKLKPAAFGGGADPAVIGFTGLTFQQLGYAEDAGTYTNLNGQFTITAGATLIITGCNDQSSNRVVVRVTDTTPESISTVVSSEGCAAAA
jgi:hypothetical protein